MIFHFILFYYIILYIILHYIPWYSILLYYMTLYFCYMKFLKCSDMGFGTGSAGAASEFLTAYGQAPWAQIS